MERETAASRIAQEALEWHALQRQGGLGAVRQAKFMEWLVASPAHLREYLAVGRLAAELAEAMRDLRDVAPHPRPEEPAARGNVVALPLASSRRPKQPQPQPRRSRAPHFVAAAVVVVAIGFAMRIAWPQSAHYVAGHGEPRHIELPDGTVAHLNAETALRIRFDLLRRRVELQRGQASFVVAKDRRPLAVHAAGLQVQDIGTTFDVSLQREQARIGVADGRVAIVGDDGEGRVLADLRAGQSARVSYRDQVVSVSEEDTDAMTAWWARRIVFRDEALRDVADQFNRLNTLRLDVDEAAGALRLTGNLRGDDLASMRAFLDQQPTLVTHVSSHGIRVSTRVATGDAPRR